MNLMRVFSKVKRRKENTHSTKKKKKRVNITTSVKLLILLRLENNMHLRNANVEVLNCFISQRMKIKLKTKIR